MDLSSKYISPADYYFGFLQHLSSNSKLDLIARLSHSLKTEIEVPVVPLESLFGAYQSEETADEIIEQLRTSRVFTRNTESL